MKKRRPLTLETLEARLTPDVTLGSASTCALLAGPQVLNPESALLSPNPGDAAAPIFDLHALETIFSNPAELDRLLSRYLTAEAPAPTADAETAGWRFLVNYTRKSIANDEARYGPLPDHDDIVQQTYLMWRQQTGPETTAWNSLFDKDSPERGVLRKTVRQVLDRVRYELRRQQRTLKLYDQAMPAKPLEQDWLDLQIDWDQGDGGLGPRERQALELRRQGMTMEEIGSEMGMVKQRVHELLSNVGV